MACMDDVEAGKEILNNCTMCLTQICDVDGERSIDFSKKHTDDFAVLYMV